MIMKPLVPDAYSKAQVKRIVKRAVRRLLYPHDIEGVTKEARRDIQIAKTNFAWGKYEAEKAILKGLK